MTTRGGETMKVDFMNYEKCLASLKFFGDKNIQAKIQPWLMDEVRQLQTPEGA